MTYASPPHQPILSYQALNQENFPQYFLLAPKHLRGPLHTLYQFARSADNIADDPTLSKQTRRSTLKAWQRNLYTKEKKTDFWPSFYALSHQYQISLSECDLLLEAFLRDIDKSVEFQSHSDTLDYCRHSAIPIGRLLLNLCPSSDPFLKNKLDRLCVGLQLLNFYQDIEEDHRYLQRTYLEKNDLEKAQIKFEDLWSKPEESWSSLKPHLMAKLDIYFSSATLDLKTSWPLNSYALATFLYAQRAQRKLSATATIFQKNKLAWYDLVSIVFLYCYDRSRVLSRNLVPFEIKF